VRALFLLTALLLSCSRAPPPAPDAGGPPPPRAFSLATWNVENFFDTTDDPGSDTVLTPTQYQAKRQALGQALRSLDADVLVFQEVENERVLADLVAQELPGAGYGLPVVLPGNDGRLINIGFLSKFPVVSATSHRDDVFTSPSSGQSYRFTRDCLEVDLDVGGYRWIVLGVHFISQSGGASSDDRRIAEATRVRQIVEEKMAADPSARVVVAGDFNDVPGSPSVTRVVGASDPVLTDVSLSVPSPDRWTYVFNGDPRQYDFVLASPGAGAQDNETTIPHDAATRSVSDHAPVVTRFLP
jgi:endonuclease/exonuclease/phosphatase family metal-dependent hydrolase